MKIINDPNLDYVIIEDDSGLFPVKVTKEAYFDNLYLPEETRKFRQENKNNPVFYSEC